MKTLNTGITVNGLIEKLEGFDDPDAIVFLEVEDDVGNPYYEKLNQVDHIPLRRVVLLGT